MKIIIAKNYDEMSIVAANEISELINSKPNCVLGLATGSTPEGMYGELIRLNSSGKVDFSKVVTFNLDEYVGMGRDNPQSYRFFMDQKLFNHINIDKDKTFIPDGTNTDLQRECREYDEKMEAFGGIDLQVLGIGKNGHIGFNEPSDYLHLGTHVTQLSEDTIKVNSRFFNSMEEVPTKAITMGLGGIMKARKILLLASGEGKAQIIARLIEGRISTTIPASILQVHRDVTVVVDEGAAALIKKSNKVLIQMA